MFFTAVIALNAIGIDLTALARPAIRARRVNFQGQKTAPLEILVGQKSGSNRSFLRSNCAVGALEAENNPPRSPSGISYIRIEKPIVNLLW